MVSTKLNLLVKSISNYTYLNLLGKAVGENVVNHV